MTRPLSSDQLHATGLRLRAIADELLADHAGAVQRNLAAAADPTPLGSGWATNGASHGTSSPVLAAVEARLARTGPGPDTKAATLLTQLHRLAQLAGPIDDGLQGWSPKRTIARCPDPTCSEPLQPGGRCPACSLRDGSKPTCDDCGREVDRTRPWPPATWFGWTDGETHEVCDRDYQWRKRHGGRPANGAGRLALTDTVIEEAAG